jgi:hypothetical protein
MIPTEPDYRSAPHDIRIMERIFYYLVAFFVLVALFFVVFGFMVDTASAQAPTKAPTIEHLESWKPARDRNMILQYDNGMEFKHHILAPSAPFPQCNEVQYMGRETWMVTQESKPTLYLIEATPNAYKPISENQWIGTQGKTAQQFLGE